MIQRTFCHLSGITPAIERQLWADGITCWDHLRQRGHSRISSAKLTRLEPCLTESMRRLRELDPAYFAGRLASREHWRLLGEFRGSVAYLDIETTGLSAGDHITTIAFYDGQKIRHYIHGQNLDQFARDVRQYRLLVTFNGKCFDVPFIERSLGVRLPQAHVDLRYVLKSLGYSGGLKAVEKRLGIERDELEGVDGFLAVLLWREYTRRGDRQALDTLLAYNVQDVLNLETLAVLAYNQKLGETPFRQSLALAPAKPMANPFPVHRRVVERCLRGRMW
jgi:uncharacterized protein YprB with RNaseH-like and TPR domain